jgi:Lrp/AsnC family leucine-responsive transcriptional regulator
MMAQCCGFRQVVDIIEDRAMSDREPERLLDDAGTEILRALQDNARISFAELGRKIGMSAPAITERVRKMEEAGIIAGYHARVNPAKIGYPVIGFVQVRVPQEHFPQVITLAREIPEIRECHHTFGQDAFLLKVVASSTEQMERALDPLREFAEIHSSVIVSTPVEKYSP